MRRVEAARVMVEARSSGEFGGEWWSVRLFYLIYLFFVCVSERKRKGRNGWREREQGESKKDYSLLESGFWGTQAQESVNLASLRGAAGRGVLGGLIRRMLSHHPSRQAGENWLAPRRVEFTGGVGGGGRGAVHWIPVTAFGLFQDLSSKLIKYPSCFPLPAVAALPLAAPSPSLHWPFDPSDYCER